MHVLPFGSGVLSVLKQVDIFLFFIAVDLPAAF